MSDSIWTEPEQLNETCLIARPLVSEDGLPVLYLLHGQFDTQHDWWSAKGQLGGILSGTRASPMLIAMPFCGQADRTEPQLESFRQRFIGVKSLVDKTFKPDAKRQGILGISMGAKQALSVFLKEKNRGGFCVLGMLSGKFQGDNLNQVKAYVSDWPSSLGSDLSFYFHYCGSGYDVQRQGKNSLTGDRPFFENNERVCRELTGGSIRTRADGLHNWFFWRPEVAEFLRAVSQVWYP